MKSSGIGNGNGKGTTPKQEIIVLLDQIRREKDPEKFKNVQFRRLEVLVEQLRNKRKGDET